MVHLPQLECKCSSGSPLAVTIRTTISYTLDTTLVFWIYPTCQQFSFNVSISYNFLVLYHCGNNILIIFFFTFFAFYDAFNFAFSMRTENFLLKMCVVRFTIRVEGNIRLIIELVVAFQLTGSLICVHAQQVPLLARNKQIFIALRLRQIRVR